jgi:hypothetical protein
MTAIDVMLDVMEVNRSRTLATLDEIAKLPVVFWYSL